MPTPVVPPTLEDAIALAAMAHRAQVYLAPGDPFILHPVRVMLGVGGMRKGSWPSCTLSFQAAP